LDYLSLSRGGKFEDASQPKIGAAAYPYTGPSGYECMPSFMSDSKGPFGRNVGPAANIRKAIRDAGFNTPVVVAGGFHNFAAAEAALVAGHADIIGMARQSLADPDWPLKVQGARSEACGGHVPALGSRGSRQRCAPVAGRQAASHGTTLDQRSIRQT
jgi:2,4-dienoyl-CoA reductase-like NADH-dependent reductase (Old Yellow Enzyme family)